MTYDTSPAALSAVGRLLGICEAYDIGISIEPDPDGWKIGYIDGMGGGELSSAYDLETAAKAAERPLNDLGEERNQSRPR